MSYSVDELFSLGKTKGGYVLGWYLKKDDPEITELEIPEEYKGERVTLDCSYVFAGAKYLKRVVIPPSVRAIAGSAFNNCSSLEIAELYEGLEEIRNFAFRGTNLKSVVLPKSLKLLGHYAFAHCKNLESVTFNSDPHLGHGVFFDCHKLPADVTLMGLVGSRDLSAPFEEFTFNEAFNTKTPEQFGQYEHNEYLNYLRPDVLAAAIKNDCFRNVDVTVMLKFLIEKRDTDSLRLAEELGLFKSGGLVDKWIEASVRKGATELTAYLLELKKRKFGFEGGNALEL